MVRVAKKKGGSFNKKGKNQPVNSDSENDHYDDGIDPNNPFGDDEVDKFHNNKDKMIMDSLNGKKKKDFHYSSDEEEVLAFDDSDASDDSEDKGENFDDDEDIDEDELEGENGDDMEEDENRVDSSWGRKKSAYYSGNRIQNEEDALLEEEEANLLQKKMLKDLDTNDFGLDAFQINKSFKILKTSEQLSAEKLAEDTLGEKSSFKQLDDESIEKVIKNLSKMSKKERLDFLKQESPELFELVRDFKEKIDELNDTLLPIYKLIKQGGFQHSNASEFIINKTKLYLMYCAHLSFYFILKSKRLTVENHPIVKNIIQYRNLCKQIEKIDDKLDHEINFIKSAIESKKQLRFLKAIDSSSPQKFKKSIKFRDSLANKSRSSLKFDDHEHHDDSDENVDQAEELANNETNGNQAVNKRAINYEIEKNKGLMPKRPKSYRNPRVRNRQKARKAQIKYKSIVPKVRTQEKRYSGEATGIRTGIVRGVKIK